MVEAVVKVANKWHKEPKAEKGRRRTSKIAAGQEYAQFGANRIIVHSCDKIRHIKVRKWNGELCARGGLIVGFVFQIILSLNHGRMIRVRNQRQEVWFW